MKLKIGMALAAIFGTLIASDVQAGVYSDDLGKCMVSKMSATDRKAFVMWIFGAMALNPGVSSYARISTEQHEEINRQAGSLVSRLITDDCHSSTVAAIKYEGGDSLKGAFELVGRVSMSGLMSDPAVTAALESTGTYIDVKKLEALALEAGVPAQKQSEAP